jgi:hypothetical protein
MIQLKASNRKTNGKCLKVFLNDETVKEWVVDIFNAPWFLLYFLTYHHINTGRIIKRLSNFG